MSQDFKHSTVIKLLSSFLIGLLLVSVFGTGTLALSQDSPKSAQSALMNWASHWGQELGPDTLHQSDPDCKYPPCD